MIPVKPGLVSTFFEIFSGFFNFLSKFWLSSDFSLNSYGSSVLLLTILSEFKEINIEFSIFERLSANFTSVDEILLIKYCPGSNKDDNVLSTTVNPSKDASESSIICTSTSGL